MEFEFPTACPQCHSHLGVKNLDVDSSGSNWVYLFGGILAGMAHQSAMKDKLVCTQCGYAFSPPSNLPARKLLKITLTLLGIAAAILLVFFILNH